MALNNIFKTIMCFAVTLVLIACNNHNKNYSVDDLLDDDDTYLRVLEECKSNQQTAENCKNVKEATLIKNAQSSTGFS